jgi:hypothetical protein
MVRWIQAETTGTVPKRDRVVWIAVAVLDNGAVTERWSTLLDPEPAPLRLPGRRAGPAAAASLRGATPLLGGLGQEPDAGELLLDLYLLELFCRASEAEASVITGQPDALGTDLLDVLDRRRGALRARGASSRRRWPWRGRRSGRPGWS